MTEETITPTTTLEQLSFISAVVDEDEFLAYDPLNKVVPEGEDPEFYKGIDDYTVLYVRLKKGGYMKMRKLNGGRIIRKYVDRLPPKAGAATGATNIVKKIPGRDKMLQECIHGALLPGGKIDIALLYQIIAFFKSVMTNKMKDVLDTAQRFKNSAGGGHNYEAMAFIVWNTRTQSYRVAIPTQAVSAASVKYERDAYDEANGDIVVVDIHSHRYSCAFAG